MTRRTRRTIAVLAMATSLVGAGPEAAVPLSPLGFAPWIAGTDAHEARMQVQRIDADTFVIRQSVRTNFEAPFLYLLLGSDRALLIDTGAGGLAIRPTVDALVDIWLSEHHRLSIPLIVAHSHGHGDHHQGDGEFAERPDTQLVGLSHEAVAKVFGIDHWPDTIAHFDLGGRALSIIPTPGHEAAHIMVYDPNTQILFSGDMLYPGRLYVPKDRFGDFVASADRLAAFKRTHPIRMVLGAHIEMTATPGRDYPMRAPVHRDEHVLELPADAIDRLDSAVRAMADAPERQSEGDFIIYPLPPRDE